MISSKVEGHGGMDFFLETFIACLADWKVSADRTSSG